MPDDLTLALRIRADVRRFPRPRGDSSNPDPKEGDIVVARIEDSITLKWFHRTDIGMIELRPQSANPEHEPIVIEERTYNWEIRRRRGYDRYAFRNRLRRVPNRDSSPIGMRNVQVVAATTNAN